jgi:hypothetical protein
MNADRARPLILALVLFVLAGTPAMARDEQPSVEFDPATFAEQKRRLVRSLDSKEYFEISDQDRQKVVDALDRMERHLTGITSVEQLDEPQRIAVFNDQELVNALLTDAREDSRLVCKREKKVGSNMPTTSCMTIAQRREAQETAQRGLRNEMKVRLCLGGGNGVPGGQGGLCSSGS